MAEPIYNVPMTAPYAFHQPQGGGGGGGIGGLIGLLQAGKQRAHETEMQQNSIKASQDQNKALIEANLAFSRQSHEQAKEAAILAQDMKERGVKTDATIRFLEKHDLDPNSTPEQLAHFSAIKMNEAELMAESAKIHAETGKYTAQTQDEATKSVAGNEAIKKDQIKSLTDRSEGQTARNAIKVGPSETVLTQGNEGSIIRGMAPTTNKKTFNTTMPGNPVSESDSSSFSVPSVSPSPLGNGKMTISPNDLASIGIGGDKPKTGWNGGDGSSPFNIPDVGTITGSVGQGNNSLMGQYGGAATPATGQPNTSPGINPVDQMPPYLFQNLIQKMMQGAGNQPSYIPGKVGF
jgi:hypothetical protein